MTVTADDLHVKRKESVKDSIDVKIADSRMKEKNDDYPQFPKNSENHTCNEEGVNTCKKRKNKDSLSETEQKESDRYSCKWPRNRSRWPGRKEWRVHVTKIYSVTFRFPLWSPVASSVLSYNTCYKLQPFMTDLLKTGKTYQWIFQQVFGNAAWFRWNPREVLVFEKIVVGRYLVDN